jgi:Icc-related predicted phosphoesterase
MKILFTPDLHGNTRLYEQMFAKAAASDADVLILGGDIFPTDFGGLSDLANGTAAYEKSLDIQREFIEGYLSPGILKFKSENPERQILYIPGNHDWSVAVRHFEESSPLAVNLHGKTRNFFGYDFIGYGCVTDSHFWVKDFVRRDSAGDDGNPGKFSCMSTPGGMRIFKDNSYLGQNPDMGDELAALKTGDPSKTVCVFHSPPYETGLDRHHSGKPIGSRAIRSFIEKVQPLISMHGHIHEGPYMSGFFISRIGHTICINPGHEKDDLHAAIIDMSGDIPSIRHTLFRNESAAK